MTERVISYTRDGLDFDVRDGGPVGGDVVIALHGFPQDSTCWTGITPALHAAGYRTLAPDQRGYSPGARPADRSAYRFRELVDDVLALADAAKADHFRLIGHDWGAQVAWLVAADQPDRVKSLTALSVPHPGAIRAAALHGQALKSWYIGLFQIPGLAERLVAPGNPGWPQLMRGLPAGSQAHYEARMRHPGALAAALNWYRVVPSELRSPSVRIGRIRVPTLYVWGAHDPALGRAAAEGTGRFVSGEYQFVVLPAAGHWLPEREAATIAPLAVDHLSEHV